MNPKKRWRMMAGFGLFALFWTAACTPAENTSDSSGSSAHLLGVRMYTTESSYPVGTEQLTVILENESDTEYYYGKEFRLEEQAGEEWVEVPFEEEMAFIAIAIQLPPQGQTEETIDLTFFEDDLTPGRYRVVKTIESEPLYAEFEITN